MVFCGSIIIIIIYIVIYGICSKRYDENLRRSIIKKIIAKEENNERGKIEKWKDQVFCSAFPHHRLSTEIQGSSMTVTLLVLPKRSSELT